MSGVDLYPDPATQQTLAFPAGVMVDFGGTAAPSGWLLCDGSLVSRATYPALFAAIGVSWGVGDGSTTFALPDMRSRVSVGAGTGSGLTARAFAAAGGAEAGLLVSHSHGAHAHGDTGTVSSDHSHSGGTAGATARHTHAALATVRSIYPSTGSAAGMYALDYNAPTTGDSPDHAHNFTTGGISANHTHATGAVDVPVVGSASTDGRMQPWVAVNKIIKA